MKKIMVTGGAGRFAQHIKNLTKDDENFQVLLPTRKEMNFEGFWDCEKYFYANQKDFDYVIHSQRCSYGLSLMLGRYPFCNFRQHFRNTCTKCCHYTEKTLLQ